MRIWYIIPIIMLLSCYNAKKAKNDIIKAKDRFPEVVEQKFNEWYKCDTFTIVKDSIRFKEWIREIHSFDTLKDTIEIRQKCPDVLVKYRESIKIVPAIHDTIKLISRVEVELFKDKYEKLRSEYEKNSKLLTKLGLISLILLLILLIIIVLKK